jgi:hypothetical protein
MPNRIVQTYFIRQLTTDSPAAHSANVSTTHIRTPEFWLIEFWGLYGENFICLFSCKFAFSATSTIHLATNNVGSRYTVVT